MESRMVTSRVALKFAPTNWRSHAVGMSGSRPYLTPRFPPTGTDNKEMVQEVQIQWKPVLQTVVQEAGGTEPIFTREDTADDMIQSSVSFSLPLDSNGSVLENIVATGNKCFTIWEAESEAAASALQKLQGGWFGVRVMDISQLRCQEMESKCQQLLVKAGELYGGAKLGLSDWQENMARLETCYTKLTERIVEGICYGEKDIFGEIMLDVSDHLHEVHKTSEPKYKESLVEINDARSFFAKAKERASTRIYIPCIKAIGQRTGVLPEEVNLSMQIILHEMMESIGWPEPLFSVTHVRPEIYVCETSIFPNQNGIADTTSSAKIVGPEACSEADAVDSGCKAVILFLEDKFGICLVDLNYNRRSDAEAYVSEAEHVAETAISIGDKILAEWELMVDGIDRCGKHCQDLAEKHPKKEPGDEVYHLKHECVMIVDRLHKACLSDFQLAKRRLVNAGTWTNK